MEFLIGFLGAILGVAVVIIVVVLIIYIKIKSTFKKVNINVNVNELAGAVKNIKTIQEQEYTRVKDVSGMTRLIEPRILQDFTDFNKEVLYSKVEKSLTGIFNAIESKSINQISDDNYNMIRPEIEEKIKYLDENNIMEEYSDIKFHKHALKQYEKKDGMAIITVSSALEYYYRNSKIKKFENLKRQTRYTTKFVYVYDEQKIGKNVNVYTVNCPNCGAPIVAVGKNIVCNFCASHIQPVNLKIWKISSYEEDYKTM